MNSESKPFSFAALAGPRVRIRDIDRVPSGSPAILHVTRTRPDFDAPGTALALAKRGLSLRAAHAAVSRLSEEGSAIVALPTVEDRQRLEAELAGCGVSGTRYGSPDRVDVRAIRDGLRLSQEEFAIRFGLEAASVRNWEQGRSEPDTATRSFLLMIKTHPDIVRDTLREHGRSEAIP